MCKSAGFFAGMFLLIAGSAGTHAVFAQDTDATHAPPKVLVITSEILKPGKFGSAHETIESQFVSAAKNAKSTQYYTAMNSMSGPARTLFLFAYDSFADWEKADKELYSNAGLGATLDPLFVKDGELLTDALTSAYRFRQDMSHNASVDIAKMRYMDIGRYKVRAGHEQQFGESLKQWAAEMDKLDPDMHWAVYQSMLGQDNGGIFLLFTPMKSLSTLDHIFSNLDKLPNNEAMKSSGEAFAAAVEGSQHNLFRYAPAMSYPPPSWVKEVPDFWQTKPAR